MPEPHPRRLTPLFLLLSCIGILIWLVACQPAPRNLRPLEPSSAVTRLQATATSSQASTEIRQTQIIVTATPSPAPLTVEVTPSSSADTEACIDNPFPQLSTWCYTSSVGDVFVHPIAFVANETTGYLLDSGRVFELPLDRPAQPKVLLAPSQFISNTKVLEPLDITLTDNSLLALDRAGDIYRYSFETETWGLDRYDRPIRDLSSHYFLALTADQNRQYLLETSYSFGLVYGNTLNERLWRVPEGYLVDLAVDDGVYYTLYRPYTTTLSAISVHRDGIFNDLDVEIEIERPRQLEIDGESLYLLDQAGSRLSILDTQGKQQQEWLFEQPISSFTRYQDGILLATRNNIHWLMDQSSISNRAIPSAAYITAAQPNDARVLADLPELILPIPNLPIAARDLRMPGAPRHYRLGVHEGVDFYWGPGREILATADGTIMRLIDDYEKPDEDDFAYWRNQALTLGYTPDRALDFYRGRQLWIDHGGGWISRYAHLSEIPQSLQENGRVAQGDLIGRVGNSGSPASIENESADSHLHYELWLGEFYLGQFLRPIETREILDRLFKSE